MPLVLLIICSAFIPLCCSVGRASLRYVCSRGCWWVAEDVMVLWKIVDFQVIRLEADQLFSFSEVRIDQANDAVLHLGFPYLGSFDRELATSERF